MVDVNEAKRLKELEKENTELKKMLADEMLRNRVIGLLSKKSCKPEPSAGIGDPGYFRWNLFGQKCLQIPISLQINCPLCAQN